MGEERGERDLLEPAMDLLSDSHGYSRESMLAEVPTPWGRPDLVAFSLPEHRALPRRTLGRGEIVLLAMLERMGPLPDTQIASQLGLSPASARSQVKHLLSRGLVENANGIIGLTDQWHHLDSICAVELKLSDWRRGLLQALRYRVFADLVYLFLARIPLTLQADLFLEHGIGLAKVGNSTRVLMAAEPVSRQNLAHARMVVEENIRRDLSSPRQRPS